MCTFSSYKLLAWGFSEWLGLVGWTGQIGLVGMGSGFLRFERFYHVLVGRGVTRDMMSLMWTPSEHGDRLMKLDS